MLGLTIVDNQMLYLGIGIELLTALAIGLLLWAMIRVGFGRKKTYSFEKKKPVFFILFIVLVILILLFILNWSGYITHSILQF
ncbi:hypothetical protein [uncultured Enterococcus sp.]|uniref:hypothetical protein n=1 Tax=uncultured Enterococcus sp. TaxID=167972 RepID=UPI0025F57A5B|nr:hypothetical protein [uncultured Enterococcus sp.]